MPTTSPASPAERQRLIDKHVQIEAMTDVLHILVGNRHVTQAPDSIYGTAGDDREPPWIPLIGEYEPYVDDRDHVFSRLWPLEEAETAEEEREMEAASQRAQLLAANLLAALAADPDYLLRRAAWLIEGVVAKQTADA